MLSIAAIVARLDAGFGGGCVVDGRDDLHQTVFHRHFDAKATELALGLDLHVGEAFGIHVARVRIESRHHAFDGVVDQLAVIDGAHIIGAHPFESVAEEIELAIGAHVVGALRGQQRDRGAETQHHAQHNQYNTLHDFCAFLGSLINHGAGSTPLPFRRSSK